MPMGIQVKRWTIPIISFDLFSVLTATGRVNWLVLHGSYIRANLNRSGLLKKTTYGQ